MSRQAVRTLVRNLACSATSLKIAVLAPNKAPSLYLKLCQFLLFFIFQDYEKMPVTWVTGLHFLKTR
jgi:hypothetical protein